MNDSQQPTKKELVRMVADIHAAALEEFPDRAFAEACLIGGFLNDPATFSVMKPIVEKQLRRKLRMKGPVHEDHIVRAIAKLASSPHAKPLLDLPDANRH